MLAALGLVLVFGGDPGEDSAPQETPLPETPAESQKTLLMQVTMEKVSLASSVIANAGAEASAAWMSLGSATMVADDDVYRSLLELNTQPGQRLSPRAVTATLGLAVADRWLMERKALAALVDTVGGVVVNAQQPLTFTDEFGETQLVVPAGASRLTGRPASWYVSGLVAGETTNAPQQARFGEVFNEVLAGIPEDADTLVQILTSLGSLSDVTISRADLADFLLEYRQELIVGEIESVDLTLRDVQPVDPVAEDSDDSEEATADPDEFVPTEVAERVVSYTGSTAGIRRAFWEAPRLADTTGSARVVIWVRNGMPDGSLSLAVSQLVDAGFVVVSGGRWQEPEGDSASSGGGDQSAAAPTSTVINGRGWAADGSSWAALVQDALVVPTATVLGDVQSIVAPGEEGSESERTSSEQGSTQSASPAPSLDPDEVAEPIEVMPDPDQRPLGDVDVVLGEDWRVCEIEGTCDQEGSVVDDGN